MDQFLHFSNVESNQVITGENHIINKFEKSINEGYSDIKLIKPPMIKSEEKIQNINAVEEIKIKQQEKNSSIEKSNNNLYTLEEVQKLLRAVKMQEQKPIIENYGSMYNGNTKPSYNEDATFTDQSLVPLGQNGNGLTNEWDHDYILLNTDKWSPALNPPPVCKTEQKCPVCPNLTTGYPLMLRDFDSTRIITAPIKADLDSMNNTTSLPTIEFPNTPSLK